MKHGIVLKSGRHDWLTPGWFLDLVRQVAPIALDPCAHTMGLVHAITEWQGSEFNSVDGLSIPWAPFVPWWALSFSNPPYGTALPKWCEKFAYEATQGVQQVVLIPARVGTRYWHSHLWHSADQICFWEGRITFVDPLTGLFAPTGGTFDCAVLYYGENRDSFDAVFGQHGQLYKEPQRTLLAA